MAKLGYVILYVPDAETSVVFYERAFGLQRRFVHESGQYAEMETGGTALAFASEALVSSFNPGFRPNRPGEMPAGSEVGLVTEDVQAAFAQAVGAGAVSVVAPHVKPWGQMVAYVRDLDGCLVELCSPIAAAPQE